MTSHTLSNVLPVFAPLFYAQGYRSTSYFVAAGIGLILVGFCFRGRDEIRELIEKTTRLFVESGTKSIMIGFALATLSVLISWSQNQFAVQFGSSIRIITYGVLGFVFLAVSFIKNE